MTAILPNHPFCRFCLLVEQQAGDALQALQLRHGLNTTLLRFCYWYAVNHQGLLSKTQIKRLLATLYAWHQRIVSPLDQLCNQLQDPEIMMQLQAISDEALTTRHTAEQIEQLLITDVLPKKLRRGRTTLTQAITHACLNISTYCQSIYVHLDDIDYVYLGEILAVVFPDIEKHKATTLCRHIFSERPLKEPLQRPLPI